MSEACVSEAKVLVLTYKIRNGLGPGDLKHCLHWFRPSHLLHSAWKEEIRLAGTRRKAFSAAAPQLWNSLPRETCLAPSLPVFHRLMKMELLKSGLSLMFDTSALG